MPGKKYVIRINSKMSLNTLPETVSYTTVSEYSQKVQFNGIFQVNLG